MKLTHKEANRPSEATRLLFLADQGPVIKIMMQLTVARLFSLTANQGLEGLSHQGADATNPSSANHSALLIISIQMSLTFFIYFSGFCLTNSPK